ncbi:MAG: chemotaxis protein CheW [Chloroflexi bacterium]|nr:chemotaxis protein CheW [Chloroflexota bacterium]MBU1747267.1 chemotaxis protein CheW [Chloroflexota bacterium]MBU1877722.1 chemotaxis protein CheW [Chloroflexota bacterium]
MRPAAAPDRIQLVVFWLGDTEFGVPIDQVRRIERLLPITRVPRAPNFLEGVVNIQGDIVPVIDLKKRFALADTPWEKQARIVVVALGDQLVGMLVDAVREVMWLSTERIEPAPSLVADINDVYLTGVGRLEDRLIILLDLDQVLTVQEQTDLAQTDWSAPPRPEGTE